MKWYKENKQSLFYFQIINIKNWALYVQIIKMYWTFKYVDISMYKISIKFLSEPDKIDI